VALPRSKRLRTVGRITGVALAGGMLSGVVIEQTGLAAVTALFYLLSGVLGYVLVNECRRRPVCPTCGSRAQVRRRARPRPATVESGVPIVAKAETGRGSWCRVCG
jgi:hypothetical protein